MNSILMYGGLGVAVAGFLAIQVLEWRDRRKWKMGQKVAKARFESMCRAIVDQGRAECEAHKKRLDEYYRIDREGQ